MKWLVFPSIPYKVTLVSNPTSSQIAQLKKTSFLFPRMLVLLKTSRKTHRQVKLFFMNKFDWNLDTKTF